MNISECEIEIMFVLFSFSRSHVVDEIICCFCWYVKLNLKKCICARISTNSLQSWWCFCWVRLSVSIHSCLFDMCAHIMDSCMGKMWEKKLARNSQRIANPKQSMWYHLARFRRWMWTIEVCLCLIPITVFLKAMKVDRVIWSEKW